MSSFPPVTPEKWRAQVEKELQGASFDKALTYQAPEGFTIQPLYTESPGDSGLPGEAPFVRGARREAGWRVCPKTTLEHAAEELAGGADALWLQLDGPGAKLPDVPLVLSASGHEAAYVERADVTLLGDPLTQPELARAGGKARLFAASGLAAHVAGANAAEELGVALAAGVAALRLGTDPARISFQLAVGRDTFAELAKLRAARLCWHKILAAAGRPDEPMAFLHAVCSPRTQTQRDPWTNMLRVTTEVFAGVLGGADCVTPLPFDGALGGEPGALGRRVARNTALVLREESGLGKVLDAAGGSYYLEALTLELARAAWKVFQAIEKLGGLGDAQDHVAGLCAASWKKRADALAKRKEAITGVSEFANLGETLPRAPQPWLFGHRDAEAFERLRDRADAAAVRPRLVLAALGPLAEHKARVGFATNFFQAGGLNVEDSGEVRGAAVCLCGSDERYAAEAVEAARRLRAGGARRLFLAGRPGALEADLRAAGVDGFIFMGCDVVAVLSELVEA